MAEHLLEGGRGAGQIVLRFLHVAQRGQGEKIVRLALENFLETNTGSVEIVQMAISVPQLIEGRDEIGVPLERLKVRLNRFIESLERLARVAQMVGAFGIGRSKSQRFLVSDDGLGKAVGQMQGTTQRVVGRRVLRVQSQTPPI